MAIRVFFDNVEVNAENIIGLRQYTHSLSNNFKLGSTVCRTFEIDVLKSAVATQPSVVKLQEEGTTYADKLVVDTIENTNDAYYKYKVADKFIIMNKPLDWTGVSTARQALVKICNEFELGTAPTITYGSAMPVALDETITARDMVGYIAELNGGYAYINANGNLRFGTYTNTSQGVINDTECSTLKIGNYHEIKRVVFDNLIHAEAGTNSEGDTLYIDPDNILFTDTDTWTVQAAVDNVYSIVNGFAFYNIEIEKCPVRPNVRAGQLLTFRDTTRTIDYPTIVQIDWTYNGTWLGGYKLDLQTSLQEETQVKDSTDRKIYKVGAEINRVDGNVTIMGKKIDGLEEHNVYFRVRANEGDVIVTNQDADDPAVYTSFTGKGMEIHVDGEKVAEATEMRFECDKGLGVQDWAIESPVGKSEMLNFYRKK